MQRLRPLSEAECYARLYGRSGESYVTVVESITRMRPEAVFALTGEDVRRRFEELLEAREPDPLTREEAA